MTRTGHDTRSVAMVLMLIGANSALAAENATLFPANKATGVNPDSHLVITFPSAPTLGTSGKIRIYDAMDNTVVDTLDLSIPPAPPRTGRAPAAPPATQPYDYAPGHFTNANTVPGTPSGGALPTPNNAQLTIIGGFTDAFHFYPVIIHDHTATLYPHNNLLTYNKTYYVRIDPGVLTLSDGSFTGISGNDGWTFTTKQSPPSTDASRLVVSADGTGDFNTVQGAVDFIPDHHSPRVVIFIRNGKYEEIVYFRNKINITFLGEDREKVLVGYANNEVFNGHPSNIGTNELPGTFPSRRAAFMGDHSSGIELVNLSIATFAKGQAEGLLLVGGQNIVSNVTISGSGDALQINDSTYVVDSTIVGDGDTLLGRGPVFFDHCDFKSAGAFMWMRSTSASHGCVCVNCKFKPTRTPGPVIARAPTNNGKSYPNTEVVLIDCALGNVAPELWGPLGGDTSTIHYWEYNSTNLSDGTPADISKRHPASKQLTMEKDSQTIANYCNPTYVLGGWTPTMAPLILTQPVAQTATNGQTAVFTVKSAAIPAGTYQWFKNGAAIESATGPTLTLAHVLANDAASYTVTVTNASGSATSTVASLTVQ